MLESILWEHQEQVVSVLTMNDLYNVALWAWWITFIPFRQRERFDEVVLGEFYLSGLAIEFNERKNVEIN